MEKFTILPNESVKGSSWTSIDESKTTPSPVKNIKLIIKNRDPFTL